MFFVRDFDGQSGPGGAEGLPQSPPAGRTLGADDLQGHAKFWRDCFPTISWKLIRWDIMVTSPDVYSNNIRFFVPRTALTEMEVIGVISDGVVKRMSQRAAQARANATTRTPVWSFRSDQSPGKEITARA